jgi:hemolysin III
LGQLIGQQRNGILAQPQQRVGISLREQQETEFPCYSPAERKADAAIHALGLTFGLAACVLLAVAAWRSRADLALLIALASYVAGAWSMLGCSALYNLTREGPRKRLFRRLDHAAIFLMIAGTYTPFALVAIGGAWGLGLLVFVWAIAAGGILVELLSLRRHDRLSVAAYLLLGWIILVALGPLSIAVSPTSMILLASGGVLYSMGVVFHLWTNLPFQNAIWHAFVLAAAACHYTAIFREFIA